MQCRHFNALYPLLPPNVLHEVLSPRVPLILEVQSVHQSATISVTFPTSAQDLGGLSFHFWYT